MATRSLIGIENDDGTIEGVYCHFDGYPEGVGAMLRDRYGEPARVRQLIAGGGLSILGPDIEPAEGVAHTFDSPAEGVCVYYGRDRGDYEPPILAEGQAGFYAAAQACGAEYCYMLVGVNRWWYMPVNSRLPFHPYRFCRLTEDAVTADA